MLYIRSLPGKFWFVTSLLAICHTELHRPFFRGRVNTLLVRRKITDAFVKYTSSGNVSLQIYRIFMVFTALNEMITRVLHTAESCEHYSAWLQTLSVFLFFHCRPLERSLIWYLTESLSCGGQFKPNSDVPQTGNV